MCESMNSLSWDDSHQRHPSLESRTMRRTISLPSESGPGISHLFVKDRRGVGSLVRFGFETESTGTWKISKLLIASACLGDIGGKVRLYDKGGNGTYSRLS